MKALWIVAGAIALLLGAAGVVLPLLPTVPFLLLAAFCFSRSSDKLHNWLITHPTFGPPIQQWHDNGAIGLKAKRLASLSIAAAFALSVVLGVPAKFLVIQAVVLCAVSVFIWTRPNGDQ